MGLEWVGGWGYGIRGNIMGKKDKNVNRNTVVMYVNMEASTVNGNVHTYICVVYTQCL